MPDPWSAVSTITISWLNRTRPTSGIRGHCIEKGNGGVFGRLQGVSFHAPADVDGENNALLRFLRGFADGHGLGINVGSIEIDAHAFRLDARVWRKILSLKDEPEC